MSIFSRARGRRPAVPSVQKGSNVFAPGSQWGDIPLPAASEHVVMGLPAASRARNLIANAVAQMSPLDLWTPDGYKSDEHPSIITRPLATMTAFAFWHQSVSTLITHGNFLGLWADFDANGYPQQCVPVQHGFWYCYYDGDGYLVYSINGALYERDQVCHVAINTSPIQPMGIGVVTQFRRSIGQALDQQNFAADTYRSGSVPAGVIEVDLPEIDVLQAGPVIDQWIANHAGGRAPAMLPNTMKFTPLQWSPEDMQFLEARTHTVGEIAFMFNMDPTDLGASFGQGSAMTYANIEQRQQARITDTYAPIGIRFEQEFSDVLPGNNTARFDADRLLRTDTKTLAEVHQIEIGTGVTSVDEARKVKGKRPLPVADALEGSPAEEAAESPDEEAAELAAGEVPSAPAKPMMIPGAPMLEETPVKVKA